MFDVLRQRNFALLWFAGLLSMTGDWVLSIGLPIYLYRLTGSTLATGGLLMVGTLPGLLLGSLAGVFIDRWDRRRTMIVVDILLAVALLPLLLVHDAETIWLIYVVRLVSATLTQFFVPAERALLPTLVGEEHLVAANSLNALNGNLARLIGPALGGLLVGFSGLMGIALLDALSFVLSALLIVRIASARKPDDAAALERKVSIRGIVDDWLAGLRLARRTPALARILLISTLAMIGEGFFGTLIAPFVIDALHGTDADFGYLLAAQAVGGIIGSILIGRMVKGATPYRLLGLGALALGIFDALLFSSAVLNAGIAPGVVFIALAGIPVVAYTTGLMTLLQTLTSDSFRGRVFGLYGALSALTTLLSAALAGILGEYVSVTILLLVFDAVGYFSVGILALVLSELPCRQRAPAS